MTDIHNNNINFGNINKGSFKKEVQASMEQNAVEEQNVSTEYKNAEDQLAVAGRSVAFKGADNLTSDMTFFLKNPKLAAQSVAFSELAESSMPYEKACGLAQAYAKQFKK